MKKLAILLLASLMMVGCSTDKSLKGQTYSFSNKDTFTGLGELEFTYTLDFITESSGIYRATTDGSLTTEWNFTYAISDDNISVVFKNVEGETDKEIKDRIAEGEMFKDRIYLTTSLGVYPSPKKWFLTSKYTFIMQ